MVTPQGRLATYIGDLGDLSYINRNKDNLEFNEAEKVDLINETEGYLENVVAGFFPFLTERIKKFLEYLKTQYL